MVKITWIGLGVMGFPMAGHLANAGHELTVYNRTAEKAEQWITRYKGRAAGTPDVASENADMVMVCVGNDADLSEVILGERGVFSTMKPGTILVDHTTTSANIAREIDKEARKRGLHFIDAPVSGGQAGAENGELSIMCGGEKEIFKKIEKIISVYGKIYKLVGKSGSGQLAKMVNQICIASVIQGLAEALNFAQNADLNCEVVLDVISGGAAGSWQMNNRGRTILNNEYDFGFAVDWMRKDLGYCLEEANRNGSPLPVTSIIDQFYKEVQLIGGGRWDTSSLMQRLKRSPSSSS